ncbi:MAG: peptide chain release factor N(5)-glutamine methyltransferase [Candidatus Dependentiae bacterium]|nr:peptide chain release factor N(5)-glutamine methyltransferase [Candidatus Dependentiae bacterium]
MHIQSQSIGLLIETITHKLIGHFTPPEEHAWWIIEAITGKKRAHLIAKHNISLTPEQHAQLEHWLHALIYEHMPLQYLIGSVPFGDLDILVEPPTLIPRPETEEWCLDLINQLQKAEIKKLTILDMCTGSGCIALALAQALPKATIYATDISNKALELAKKNAIHNKISNVTFLHSDLFDSISDLFKFDIIVANPPYIDQKEWETLAASVSEWEDKKALIAPENGLAIIEEILKIAPQYLKENKELKQHAIPQILIEIGHQQGISVHALMMNYRYNSISIKKDLAHKDRVACGRVHGLV